MKKQIKRITRLLMAVLLASALFVNSVPSAYVSSVAKMTDKKQNEETDVSADPDPELRRHNVDYNYGYEGEGIGGGATVKTGIARSPFTKSTYRHASRFKNYQVAHGIDVSEWQGNINWGSVKKAGVEFAIIRVGYRGSGTGALRADKRYIGYIKGALKAGIKVGVYIYSQATTPGEARAEANFLLSRIKGYNISMPVVLDYEFYTSTSGRLYHAHLTKREATEVCRAFCRTVENAGYTPMVYGNADMFNNHLYAEELASDYLMWLANFGANNGKDRGFATIYTGTYSFWQYTSRGRVPGIAGNVDCNFWYKTSEITPKKIVSTGINITDSSVTLTTNNKLYLYHSLQPAGCVDDIRWTSSKPTVAYVKDGYVYGVSGGETVITATTSTGATDSCKVVVSENMNDYKIQCDDEYIYTGREITPDISVVSKKKAAVTGRVKKQTELFTGPDTSYKLAVTIPKKANVTIYGDTGIYYAASVKMGTKTYYGYCLKKSVTASKSIKTLVPDRDYTVKYSENINIGVGLVEVSGAEAGIYSGTISSLFSINEQDISKVTVGQISDQILVAGQATPSVSLYYNGKPLKAGVDYNISYAGNIANGQELSAFVPQSAAATVTGIGNFTGTKVIPFSVGTSTVASVDAIADQVYTGMEVKPEVVVRAVDGTVLKNGTDYYVTYSNNINVGSAGARIILRGSYQGSLQLYFNIVERDIEGAELITLGQYTYNQKPQNCDVNVTYQGVALTEGTDYNLEYSNNCCAGLATVKVIGTGNYKGIKEGSYTISPADIRNVTVGAVGSQAYAEGAVTPALQLRNGNTGLLQGVDYNVKFSNNKTLGKASCTIIGTGNYKNARTVKFSIVKKKISDCKLKTIGNKRYNKKRIMPKVTLRNHGKKLKKGRDYTVSYGGNKSVGKATITIKGKGKYKGTKKVSFRIVR